MARWRWLWPFTRSQLPTLTAVLALSILASLLSISLPLLSKQVVDAGLIGRDFPLLIELCLAILAVALAGFVVGGLNRWLYVRASGRILFALREDVYGRVLALPPSFFRSHPVGDLVTRLDGDVAELQRFSTDTLLAVVNGVLLLAATAAIMIVLYWPLALLAGAVLPVQLLLRHRVRPLLTTRTRAVREQAGEIAHAMYESLGAVRGVQTFTAEDWERARLARLNREYLRRLMSQQLLSYGLGATSGLLSHAATAAVFIYGGHQVITGTLTVGTLIAFVAYMTRSTGSAVSLLNLYVAYQRAAVSFDRVAELVHADEASAEVPALPLPSPSTVRRGGEIILEDVGLGEAACGRRLLENCSLIIPAGAKVTICGPSGAGKSTLVDALTRFGPLDRGRILLDGTDITTITTGELRRRICVLQPEPVIFGGSILDNVRYGSFEAREGQVLEVTHRVGLGAEVAAERDGRTGPLGNGGKRLSAGQRQRVAIARALLRDPQVLVLDEALAHLDREAARELHALIDRTFAGRTRLVISHAPERVPAADMCLEFHGGRLAPCAQGEPRTHAVSACPPEDPGTPGAGSPGNVRRRGS